MTYIHIIAQKNISVNLLHIIHVYRMVTFYGLLISMFAIPWKCYRMSMDTTFLEKFVSKEMVFILLIIH